MITKKSTAKRSKQTKETEILDVVNLGFYVDAQLRLEKLRVATQVRGSHLARQGRVDQIGEQLLEHLKKAEGFVDNAVGEMIESHPAYPWFSKIKGVGPENIGKIVGQIDMTKCTYISSLWKWAGFHVDSNTGRAPRRIRGQKIDYNNRLRSMCWRLGTSLMKAGLRKECTKCGAFVGQARVKCPKGHTKFKAGATSKFMAYYLDQKGKYTQRFKRERKRIVPAEELPQVKGKKVETKKFISKRHVHMLAMRKTLKLFLSSLWLVWRQALGLPMTEPYVIEHLGHAHFLDPWEFVDEQPGGKRKPH